MAHVFKTTPNENGSFSPIEALFRISVSDMATDSILSLRIITFKQKSSYRIHEHCTPNNVSPEMCLCNLS